MYNTYQDCHFPAQKQALWEGFFIVGKILKEYRITQQSFRIAPIIVFAQLLKANIIL